ncbi:hypothetical protein UWK_02692 [Desulfocapsa sulfexigens DSM 10523]|uniref:Uncharacterized protein n=1 Tax=Desulfocapsa sulfexigens (strain DSM 10523 / SB164P1) TaxID=1167006 RepID=M1P6Y2_DESSD|nr:hypothetical protein [Desulfocapsa sulfexigens]AGF79228.1 hypothetical protein UWK_02692 [Desulfocapsa sulfexigens DSM 10523]
MQKKIWLSAFNCSQETVQSVMGKLQSYGLAADGHFFTDDLDKMAWAAPRKQLVDHNVSMWLLVTSAESLQQPSFRYGLAMLALGVQAERGQDFPIVILQIGEDTIQPDTLPTPFANVKILPLANESYAAKLIAIVHTPLHKIQSEYRMDVYGIPNIGQWFEVGPLKGNWKGAIFGVSDGEIKLHAVGPAGQLPEKTVLNYPQQGLEITMGDQKFTAWGVQNEIDSSSSYYLKVAGSPKKIMFCPYSSEEETEAFIVSLQ